MEGKRYNVNNIQLHVMEGGPEEGERIIFLHGFPEFWYSWKRQLPYFIQKGYRVLAPDQRGYNLSDKPEGIEEYTLDKLEKDIVELIRITGNSKTYIVGHDWGGIVAWQLASQHPELIHKVVLINIPHPSVIRRTLKKNVRQMIKSLYVFFMQIPKLPEVLLKSGDYKMLSNAMVASSNNKTFSKKDLDDYHKAWSQPGSLSGMINWYRAARYKRESDGQKVKVPVLMIWGRKEKFLIEEMAEESIGICETGKLKYFDDATHWVHHERSEEVNKMIYGFIINGS